MLLRVFDYSSGACVEFRQDLHENTANANPADTQISAP